MITKNLKHTLTSSKFEKQTTKGVSKCKNKRCGVCNIIREGKSFTFENNIRNKLKFKQQFKKCCLHNQIQQRQRNIH